MIEPNYPHKAVQLHDCASPQINIPKIHKRVVISQRSVATISLKHFFEYYKDQFEYFDTVIFTEEKYNYFTVLGMF